MTDIFKQSGIKKTKQRNLVYQYIVNHNRVTIKDIIKDNPNLDVSTVYRVIDILREKQIIIKVIENDTLYYLPRFHNHVHYLECEICHHREILDICPYDLVDLKGYHLIQDKKIINGICHNCQSAK